MNNNQIEKFNFIAVTKLQCAKNVWVFNEYTNMSFEY